MLNNYNGNSSEGSEEYNINDDIFWNTEPYDQGSKSITDLGNSFAPQKDNKEKQKVIYTYNPDKEDQDFLVSNKKKEEEDEKEDKITSFFNKSLTNEELLNILFGRGLENMQHSSLKNLRDEQRTLQNSKDSNNNVVEEINLGENTEIYLDPLSAFNINQILVTQEKSGEQLNCTKKIEDLSDVFGNLNIDEQSNQNSAAPTLYDDNIFNYDNNIFNTNIEQFNSTQPLESKELDQNHSDTSSDDL